MSPQSSPAIAIPSNEEKKRLWDAYHARKATRVPVTLGSNPRIVLLNPALNPEGVQFREYFEDPAVTIAVQRRHQDEVATRLSRFTDSPLGLPEKRSFHVDWLNTFNAAHLGAPIAYRENQIPDTHPTAVDDREAPFRQADPGRPMDNAFIRKSLERHEAMAEHVERMNRQEGVEGRYSLQPFTLGFDGPLTVAVNLRGEAIFSDMVDDPEYVHRFLGFITEATLAARLALRRHFGQDAHESSVGLADDSIQLISPAMYEEFVLPYHKRWYSALGGEKHRGMHLCGDATRHFPMIARELGVKAFDTGFPVDHGALRRTLGPEIEISGGPEVALLVGGTPEEVYARTRAILLSGVKEGGRFILREGNNLPPCTPEANLEAMYRAALDFGGIG